MQAFGAPIAAPLASHRGPLLRYCGNSDDLAARASSLSLLGTRRDAPAYTRGFAAETPLLLIFGFTLQA